MKQKTKGNEKRLHYTIILIGNMCAVVLDEMYYISVKLLFWCVQVKSVRSRKGGEASRVPKGLSVQQTRLLLLFSVSR